MDQVLERKSTMHRFVSLAQAYRGWSKTQTAERLGREVAKVVPESGNPKLDLVVAIADALEWPVGDVAETLWRPGSGARAPGARTPFHELDAQSRQAHRDGRYHDMLELASLMLGAAASGNERAIAFNRQCGAHDGLGQFMRSLSSVQQGLVQPDVLPRTRLMLRVNLASAHYALWHLVESRSIAHELVHQFTEHPPTDRFERVAQAFAFAARSSAMPRRPAPMPRARSATCAPPTPHTHRWLGTSMMRATRPSHGPAMERSSSARHAWACGIRPMPWLNSKLASPGRLRRIRRRVAISSRATAGGRSAPATSRHDRSMVRRCTGRWPSSPT